MAMLTGKLPRAHELMASAREDVLAFRHFPLADWRKLWSTNLLELVNEAIKRRSRVVGFLPVDDANTRLVGAVLLEQVEHWQLEGRRLFSLDSMAAIPPAAEELTVAEHQDNATARFNRLFSTSNQCTGQ